MIPLIGLLISFYVAMRGLDWLVVAKDARHNSVYYGRIVVGILTILGAIFFALTFIVSGSVASESVNYLQ
jgi:hypothetical protein